MCGPWHYQKGNKVSELGCRYVYNVQIKLNVVQFTPLIICRHNYHVIISNTFDSVAFKFHDFSEYIFHSSSKKHKCSISLYHYHRNREIYPWIISWPILLVFYPISPRYISDIFSNSVGWPKPAQWRSGHGSKHTMLNNTYTYTIFI